MIGGWDIGKRPDMARAPALSSHPDTQITAMASLAVYLQASQLVQVSMRPTTRSLSTGSTAESSIGRTYNRHSCSTRNKLGMATRGSGYDDLALLSARSADFLDRQIQPLTARLTVIMRGCFDPGGWRCIIRNFRSA